MTSDDKSSLQGLEVLMNEFFTTSNNDRKREIENVLNSFVQQNGAWRSCAFFLNNTKNHYVLMYSLSVFEHLVNKRWSGVSQTEKLEVRHVLSYFLMNNHQSLPVFIKNKLVKVLVDIGRQDWPHFYPDFFTNILEVLHQPLTTNLGLIMLRITSEELLSSSEDLSVQRKEELHKLLLNQVPTLLTMLGTFLENILEKHRRVVSTATPPPSPTHGESSQSISPRGDGELNLFSLSPPRENNNRHSPLIGRLLSQNKTNLNNPLPPLDPDSEELSSLALACLAHLFSWIPLSTHITPSLLATVFCFAEFGCDVLASGSAMTTAGSSTRLGVLAMDCVNEILSKNCVPAEFEEFLLRLFQQTFHLLQRITKDTGLQTTGHKLLELDERYIEKFTEFLRLFVSVHLRRVEANLHFPVIEFMSLLLKYTIKQPDNEVFFSCLDIWMTFLDYLSSKMLDTKENYATEVHPTVRRYRDILVLLLTEMLKKIQFTYNQTELEELDNEELNEDSETEWQRFLRHSLEVVAKVSELLPNDAFSILFPLFVEYSEAFVGLRSALVKTAQGCELNVKGENECRRIHCTSRDLTTLQRIFGRLAGHFIGETHFQSRFDDGLSVVKRLCDLALYNTETRAYNVKSDAARVLSNDFREVAAGTLASLQVYCHWLSQLHLHLQVHEQYENEFVSIVSSCIDAILPLIHEEVPERVLLPASHFLVSLTTSVRPSFFVSLETVQKLYHEVTIGKLRRTAVEIETLIFRALSNALVLPWPNQTDDKQDWPSRSNNHDNLIKALTINYQQMTEHTSLPDSKRFHAEAKSFIRRTLGILKDLVEAVSGEATKSKTIVYKSVQESLHTTLTLFPIYIHEPDVVESILAFLLAVFGALQPQLGVAYTEQIIHRLLGMFTQDQLRETMSQEMSAGTRVLEKFLRILRLLAQQTGSSFKTLLPNIITFCLDQIHPLIAERSAPDIKTEFFELLHQLLLNNWRYFFRPNVQTRVTHGDDGACENQGQFVKMMEAFGQTFTQTDITVFKQNLLSLEDLNLKRKLYQKPIFSDGMLFHFLNVFLQVLVRRSHDLLQEEIAIALYNMASSDFDKFYLRFLPEFLTGCEGLYAEQKAELSKSFKMDKDLPSFTRGVHRFVSDVRYYRIYNSSLPSGTVTF
ncbi:exportin-6-like [Dendronephthya gigantea]|uniref:exportin-6-like n=1 Tax=Dendronephthya gigantea TaxID=151771 RepID=UPI00106A8F50|nr:exportin-6-like [Dendronephthya gigantea]